MFFEHPFTTYIGCNRDPKFNGDHDELKEYQLREDLINRFIAGDVGEDAVLDCLNEQGINPYDYLNSVEGNIEFIMANNIQITDAGLWVPQYCN